MAAATAHEGSAFNVDPCVARDSGLCHADVSMLRSQVTVLVLPQTQHLHTAAHATTPLTQLSMVPHWPPPQKYYLLAAVATACAPQVCLVWFSLG